MTNTVKELHIQSVLTRLVGNTGLNLEIQHSASGYSLLLVHGGNGGGTSNKVIDILGLGQSKGDIYRQMLTSCKVLEAMHQKVLAK